LLFGWVYVFCGCVVFVFDVLVGWWFVLLFWGVCWCVLGFGGLFGVCCVGLVFLCVVCVWSWVLFVWWFCLVCVFVGGMGVLLWGLFVCLVLDVVCYLLGVFGIGCWVGWFWVCVGEGVFWFLLFVVVVSGLWSFVIGGLLCVV
jgi:hypothetical protein